MMNQNNQIPCQNNFDLDKETELGIVNSKYENSFCGHCKMSINDAIKKIKNDVLLKLRIPENYKNYSFKNFDTTDNLESFNKIKSITEKGFVDDALKKISMVLWSKGYYGVGKTRLLYSAVLEYAISDKNIKVDITEHGTVTVEYTGFSICVLSEYEFLDKVRDTFKPNSEISEGDVFKGFSKFDILCIDDLLKYTPSNLDFYQRTIFRLVDERYKKGQALFLTTNKSIADITNYVGYPVADRINEMTKGKEYQFQFKGVSHRAK